MTNAHLFLVFVAVVAIATGSGPIESQVQDTKVIASIVAYRNGYSCLGENCLAALSSLHYVARIEETLAGSAPPRYVLLEFENCSIFVEMTQILGQEIPVYRSNKPHEPTEHEGPTKHQMLLSRKEECDCAGSRNAAVEAQHCTAFWKSYEEIPDIRELPCYHLACEAHKRLPISTGK